MRQEQPAEPFRGSSSPLSRQQLRARRYVRLARDVYGLADTVVDLHLQCQALLTVVPDAVVSHHTAALLHRLPVPTARGLHLTRPEGRAPVRRAGTVPHVRRLPDDDVCDLGGLRVTSLFRTFLDLAESLPVLDLVVLGDAVARRSGVERLAAAVAGAPPNRGVGRARAALRLVDAGADSPAETRVRLLLHAAGFGALRHGVVVHDAAGGWVAAPDLADPQARVAVQYDGLVHLERGARRWQADVDRDEQTRAAGWQLVVLTGRDLRLPHLAVQKVRAAYARAVPVEE